MNILNLSSEPLGKLISWLPHNLKAEKVVFLPDACPGKSPLPTGTVVYTKQDNWRTFALSDCGCGLRLMKSVHLSINDLTADKWNEVANRLRANKGKLGDLGGGNHFLDALKSYDDNALYFLVHTGSRNESGLVDHLVDSPDEFDAEFLRIVAWAEENRKAVQREIEAVFGSLELLLDLSHNTNEPLSEGGAIIRKGAVRVKAGEMNIIPSSMSGDIVLVRAKDKVQESLFSLSHGTGRALSRSECKPLAETYNFKALRENILIPDSISDSSLRTEGPFAYRNLDSCLALLHDYLDEVKRFSVIGYIGHL